MEAVGKAYSYPTLILWESMHDNGHKTTNDSFAPRQRERMEAG